jgi:CubicO group peptidase (beta-lactamase class C family)
MKKICTLLFLCINTISSWTQEVTSSLEKYPEEVHEALFNTMKDYPNNTQLAVAIVKNGETQYYGAIKSNNNIEPIYNEHSIFEIGSITKVFTATILSSLVNDGLIQLHDNINEVYPFEFNKNLHFSYLNLSNHTSGLPSLPTNISKPNLANPYVKYNAQSLENYLKNEISISNDSIHPYSYSNLGLGLLAYSLGKRVKKPFTELLKERILIPYKLSQTYIHPKDVKHTLVIGQDSAGARTTNWEYDALFGCGGILSSIADLAKFATAQFDTTDAVLALTRQYTCSVNDNIKMGLGWHIITLPNNTSFVWHNGDTGGYTSSMAVNVNDQSAVIILSNLSAYHEKMGLIDKLCFSLIKTLSINN